jgi:hypothetical protein
MSTTTVRDVDDGVSASIRQSEIDLTPAAIDLLVAESAPDLDVTMPVAALRRWAEHQRAELLTELEGAGRLKRGRGRKPRPISAGKWNSQHAVGTRVRYYPVAGEPGHLDTSTRSAAWPLGDGRAVVLIVGRTGGVHLDHLEVLP